MNIKKLKQIGSDITGLKITSDIKKDTALLIKYSRTNWKVKDIFININTQELDNIPTNELRNRGHSKEFLYLQVLLHEIAHYKQYKKIGLFEWVTKHFITRIQREKIADRYASRYYKKFKEAI